MSRRTERASRLRANSRLFPVRFLRPAKAFAKSEPKAACAMRVAVPLFGRILRFERVVIEQRLASRMVGF